MKGGPRRKSISSDPPTPRARNDVISSGNDESEYYEQNAEQQQQQQQQQMLMLNDGGDRYEEEEGDEYDEEYEEQFDGLENAGEGDDQDERPKLAEGFYEIESVRKKRSRKGKVQYLIKWWGWPEAANTWEPVENLMSCSDFVDAFEERMKGGKQKSNRKNKRKNTVNIQPPAKKKKQQQPQQQQQQQGSPAASYDVPAVKLRIIDEPLPHTAGNDPSCSKWAENSVKSSRNPKKTKKSTENGSLLVSQQIAETNEMNMKLSELKITTLTDKETKNMPAVTTQENPTIEVTNPANGISNVNGPEPVWVSRNGGAKRRKSGSVKRFKQDIINPNPNVTNGVHDAIERINGVVVEHGIQNFDQMVGSMNVVETSRSMYAITKIIKPIEYSTSTLNDAQDILVTFSVLRSDGKEVMVDNRYLKANYPLLLINFYEQHIQYNTPSD